MSSWKAESACLNVDEPGSIGESKLGLPAHRARWFWCMGAGGAQAFLGHPAGLFLSHRSESRSAVRIKVLDVLSFVLLINRQFYEVCV